MKNVIFTTTILMILLGSCTKENNDAYIQGIPVPNKVAKTYADIKLNINRDDQFSFLPSDEVFSDLLNPDDYVIYLRTDSVDSPFIEYDAYTFDQIGDSLFSFYGTDATAFDLDGSGEIDVLDLINASSSYGLMNTELDFNQMEILFYYSSHWEWVQDAPLIVDGIPVEVYPSFMAKTQANEDCQSGPFKTIEFIILTDHGLIQYYLINITENEIICN